MNNNAVLIYLRLYDNILKCLCTFVHNFAAVGKAIFSRFKNTSKIVVSIDARCKRNRLLVDVYPHSCWGFLRPFVISSGLVKHSFSFFNFSGITYRYTYKLNHQIMDFHYFKKLLWLEIVSERKLWEFSSFLYFQRPLDFSLLFSLNVFLGILIVLPFSVMGMLKILSTVRSTLIKEPGCPVMEPLTLSKSLVGVLMKTFG